jgi:hypothetical protein
VVTSTVGTRPDGEPPDDWVLISDAPPEETASPS